MARRPSSPVALPLTLAAALAACNADNEAVPSCVGCGTVQWADASVDDSPVPANLRDYQARFFPDPAQLWRGVVYLRPGVSFNGLAIDGRALPFVGEGTALDTRPLADGAHTLEIFTDHGDVRRVPFRCDNSALRDGPPFVGRFTEITATQLAPPPSGHPAPYAMHFGAVAGDLDGDLDLDLVVWTPIDVRNYRLISPGRYDLGTERLGPAKSAAFVDLDNDGIPELVLGAPQLRVYRVGVPFEDVSARAFAGVSYQGEWLGVTAVDLDSDGLLDLAVGQMNCAGGASRVFRNEGDLHLVDVAPTLGLDYPDGATFAFAMDRLPGDEHLHVWNLREGCRPGETRHRRYARTDDLPRLVDHVGTDAPWETPMGTAWIDGDGNGQLDFFVALGLESRVWPGPAHGPTIAPALGLATHLGTDHRALQAWATVLFDPNLDGQQDLFVTFDPNPGNTLGTATNALFLQSRRGQFYDYGEAAGLGAVHDCNAAATEDLDGDGDGDLTVGCSDGVHVYRNDFGGRTPGRTVALHGTVSNADGVHAWIETSYGERRLVRGGGQPFAGGVARETVRAAGGNVTVHWPSGIRQTVDAGPDPVLHITEPRVFTLSRRRVTTGAPEPVEVAVFPAALGSASALVRVELSTGTWSTPPSRGADGVWRGVLQPPRERAVVALTVTVGDQTLLVRPRVFVR